MKECCKTCKNGCRHDIFRGESFCLYRGKWQFSDFKCAGYKPNLRARWYKIVSFVKNGR